MLICPSVRTFGMFKCSMSFSVCVTSCTNVFQNCMKIFCMKVYIILAKLFGHPMLHCKATRVH